MKFVFTALCLEGVSILLMYFAYGGMINVITQLQFMKFENPSAFYQMLEHKTNFSDWQILFFFQFATFFLGIILLGAFMAQNYWKPPDRPSAQQ